MAESVKAYIKFEEGLKAALPKEERAAARPIDVSGAADGRAGGRAWGGRAEGAAALCSWRLWCGMRWRPGSSYAREGV